MNQREQLLNEIGIVSFVLVDLGLYLDTHPNDKNALEYFKHYAKIYKQMESDFAVRYYPLTLCDNDSCKEWDWGNAPLPWEGECC